jgi:hypothetical protein
VSDSDSDFGSEFESNYELELSDNSDFDLSWLWIVFSGPDGLINLFKV